MRPTYRYCGRIMGGGEATAAVFSSDDAPRLQTVEARIGAYHHVSMTEVLSAIEYLRDPGDSVIAGGSLTVGLGNRLSDLDIVVSGPSRAESSRVPLEHWLGTLRVDAWKLSHEEMSELVERAETVLQGGAPVDGAFGDIFEEADLKLLHRLAFGVLVDGPPLRLEATHSYREIAGDLLAREYAERTREAAFVTQLAVLAEDPIGAAFNARLAVQSALHATVCVHELPFTGDKWLRERLALDAPRLLDLHESFAVLPNDDGEVAQFAGRALDACRMLTGCDLSLPELAPQVRFDAGDLKLFAPGGEHYLVSVAGDGMWELDETEAAAWSAVDAKGQWACDPSSPPLLKLSYELYAAGAAKLRWQRGLPVAELALGEGAVT